MFLKLFFALGAVTAIAAPALQAQSNEHSRSVLSAREFLKNSALLAHARQTVVLDNDPDASEEPVIRYELEAGSHNFCWSRRGSLFTEMTLEDTSGEQLFKMPLGLRCAKKELPAGIYQLRFLNSGRRGRAASRNARIEVDPPSPPVVDPNGDPLDGWWAAQNDPSDEPQHRIGRLRAQTPFKDVFKEGYLLAPFVVDYTSQQIDEFSLFSLLASVDRPALLGVPSAGKLTAWSSQHNELPEKLWIVNDIAGCGSGDRGTGRACWDGNLRVVDLGNQRFSIVEDDNYAYFQDYAQHPNASAIQLGFTVDLTPPGRVFKLLFRFFSDSNAVGALQPGQAALFQACGYHGKTSIFAPGEFSLSAYDSAAITIDHTAKSVRLGNNTAVDWHSASSQPEAIVADTDCLPAGSAAPSGDDFEVLPLVTLLADPSRAQALDKKCIRCKLAGTTLTNLDLGGWDFSGSDLSGATLAHVKLNDINLDGALLAGTKFSCVDFSGTDPNNPVDLTTADFTHSQWVQGDGCKSTFKYTLLSVTNLPPTSWKNLDLSYATFVDAKGRQLSNAAHPLDLGSVGLTGVSLEGAILDYATGLTNAHMSQVNLNGASLQHVDLSGATLYGAQLSNANLDGARLATAVLTQSPDKTIVAANLQGAFLRNVNLTGGQLSGANFTNASFYGTTAAGSGNCTVEKSGFTNKCATAARAVMNNTQFAGAYLFGVDFTGAKIQGVQFANAVLVGTNFAGALVSADDKIGTNSGFSGAFLQGAHLPQALAGITLADAFVDFSPQGNTLYLQLSGQHTIFPGYWGSRGRSVCAQATYFSATSVPAADSTLTCPDGDTYPNACGPAKTDGSNTRWESPVDITEQASYQFDATYTKAPADGTAICNADSKWIAGVGLGRGEPRPQPDPHPHPHPHPDPHPHPHGPHGQDDTNTPFARGHDHDPETSN
jgi:uncharacterized protein YjbI with pentapeptide repeats